MTSEHEDGLFEVVTIRNGREAKETIDEVKDNKTRIMTGQEAIMIF